MRVVITGASGFVGRMLVHELRKENFEVLLIGRDISLLREMAPGCDVDDYSRISEILRNDDLVINLAVINSDRTADESDIYFVNVDLSVKIAKATKAAGGTYVNVSSIHALDESNRSGYAISKRKCVSEVDAVGGSIVHLYLPAIYGEKFSGSLAFLNLLPRSVAQFLLGPISALKPTLALSHLVNWVMRDAKSAPNEVILTERRVNDLTYRIISRALNFIVALVGLVCLFLPMLAIWVMIRIDLGGPALFMQPRVGRNGAIFICYKFRTMPIGTRQAATHEVNLVPLTWFGRKLRRYKVDELPQLWNVLCGDMNLVGPRPCLPVQKDLVSMRAVAGVLDIRPGITGLAQIRGVDMSRPDELILWDVRYLALRGLFLDSQILFKTLIGRGRQPFKNNC